MTQDNNVDIDVQIAKLLEVVKKQRDEWREAEKEVKRSWVTNCSYHMNGNQVPVNIQTATENRVIEVMADLVTRDNALSTAANILGVKCDHKHGGYSYEEWVSDLKKRLSLITVNDKKKKLDDLEARLDKLVSPEKRREMELAQISKEIGI